MPSQGGRTGMLDEESTSTRPGPFGPRIRSRIQAGLASRSWIGHVLPLLALICLNPVVYNIHRSLRSFPPDAIKYVS